MAAFFRGFLLFLFGALAGAGGILFFTPGFQVVVSRGDTAIKPVEFGGARPTSVAAAPVPPPNATKAAPAAAAAPVVAPPAVAAQPAPAQTVAPAAPAAAPSAEPALDFAYLSRNLITWPTAITTKSATTVAVFVDGQKAQDLALEAGAVLQLTKVLADGNLEVRAKGAKFEIKSTLTDFTAELAKRVAELVSKGTKLDSPFPAAAEAVASAPPPTTASVVPAPAVAAKPKGSLTLEERVNVLFGKKPVEEAPSAPVMLAPPAVAAPSSASTVTSPAPVAPAPDTKEAEKAKDLDRKINQLFR